MIKRLSEIGTETTRDHIIRAINLCIDHINVLCDERVRSLQLPTYLGQLQDPTFQPPIEEEEKTEEPEPEVENRNNRKPRHKRNR